MKKYFISTLSAIALGIGGLLITAPAFSTDADAQNAVQHFFDTCGIDTITRCAYEHRTYIWTNGDNFGYKSGRGNLPYASNGADYKAYDYLKNRIESGTLTDIQQEFWEAAFNRFFPDGVRPPPPMLTEEELEEATARLNHQIPGNTPQDQLEAFNNRCEREGGVPTQRFQFGTMDYSANQCRVESTVEADPQDPTVPTDPTGLLPPGTSIETVFVSFEPPAVTPNPGDPFSTFQPPLFQVTPLGRFGTAGNENPFEGEEQQVISDHRDRIVELQEEVTEHDEALASMLQLQSRNTDSIRANTAAITNLDGELDTHREDISANTAAIANLGVELEKKSAGIALAYALASPGVIPNTKFSLSGSVGTFESENAYAFTGSALLTPTILASFGVGVGGSGDSSVSGGRASVTLGW